LDNSFDVIIVGSSFSGSFFLHRYLPKADANARILVLERGTSHSHKWQIEHKRLSSTPPNSSFVNRTPEQKYWELMIGLGGASNAWWAATLRLLPNDFKMKTQYGVGVDWPVSYEDLEPYYTEAETIMLVSGAHDGAPYPRSQPYPQPEHRFNEVDKLLKAAYPDLYFQQPNARARIDTKNRRHCCGIGVCGLCPTDSKFTILNEMSELYDDPRVTLLLEAEALHIDIEGGRATGVRYLQQGREQVAKANLVVLGANTIFNPHLLLRSGVQHPLLGKRLGEQTSMSVKLYLDGVNNFQGSTSITGSGYMLYDGPHRSEYSGCLVEAWNVPDLRLEKGRWQQKAYMKFIFEDLPSEENYVTINAENPRLPETVHQGTSDYAKRGIAHFRQVVSQILSPLPIERMEIKGPSHSEGHILGTTVMGNDAATSIVDKHLIHHQIRNLMVLGGSVFPTYSPTNPTLTMTALTLWAVDHL